MKFYGPLEEAGLELLSSDPSNLPTGRIWYNTVSSQIKFRKDGTLTRALLLNDAKLVIGNSVTAASNVRIHRGGVSLLQFVTGDDTTTEASMSTSLGILSFRTESGDTASRPAFGNIGRLYVDTTLSRLMYDNGAAWVSTGYVDDGTVTTLKIVDSNVTTAKIADSNVTTAKIADSNVTYAKIAKNYIDDVPEGVHPQETGIDLTDEYHGRLNSGSDDEHDYLVFQSNTFYTGYYDGSSVFTSQDGHMRKAKLDDFKLDMQGDSGKRVMQYFKNQGAATATNLGFIAAPTLTATAANGEADYPDACWMKHTSGAVSGNFSGMVTSNFTQFNHNWEPEFEILVRMGADASGANVSAYVGFCSADPSGATFSGIGASSNPGAIELAGFYFYMSSSAGPGGDLWSFNPITSDGSNVAGSSTRTFAEWWYTMAESGQTHLLRCALRAGGTEAWFWINNRLVAIHKTDMPTGACGFAARVTTREAVAHTIYWANLTIKHK